MLINFVCCRFRWTQLSLENLASLRTAKSIREALRTLPKTLAEVYIHMLERISPNDMELSRNTLFWLSFSKRLLTLSLSSWARLQQMVERTFIVMLATKSARIRSLSPTLRTGVLM